MATTLAEAVAERSRMNKELLIALAMAMGANERAQQRFRIAVLMRLSRVETMLQMIHGAQIVEAHGSKPGFEEKTREHAKDAEEFISQKSHELGLAMVKYIYAESDEPSARRGRRQKWSDWEI